MGENFIMVRLNRKKKMPWKEKVFIILMLTIPVIHFLVFWLYVNFDSLFLAFQAPESFGSDKVKWTLDNFKYIYNEFFGGGTEMWIALRNTLLYFFFGIAVFPLALLMTYFIYKKVPGYKIFRILFYFPTIISSAATVSIFKYIIAGNGPISLIYAAFGKEIPLFLGDSRYAIWTLIFYTHFFGLGSNLVLLGGTMSKVDVSVLEAARIDGATQMQEFIKMIIPMMWPTIATILTLSFTGIFTASGPVLLFTRGAFKTTSLSYWIYDKVRFGNSLNQPAAVGMVFMLLSIPIVFGMRYLLNRHIQDVEG